MAQLQHSRVFRVTFLITDSLKVRLVRSQVSPRTGVGEGNGRMPPSLCGVDRHNIADRKHLRHSVLGEGSGPGLGHHQAMAKVLAQ
jgi:hypothetical protein